MNQTLLDGAVTISPDILGGTPVFTGSRVPIENLFDFLSRGFELSGFLKTFPRVRPEFAQRVLAESSRAVLDSLRGHAS